MTKQEKQNEVAIAMRYTGDSLQAEKNGERAEIYLLSDELPKDSEVRKILMRNIWDDRIGGNEDLSYEICAKACDLVRDIDLTDEDDIDSAMNEDLFYENESASCYTGDRLGYLNAYNESEITEKVKKYNCDIQTACAVWYDDMVRSVALELRDYILVD